MAQKLPVQTTVKNTNPYSSSAQPSGNAGVWGPLEVAGAPQPTAPNFVPIYTPDMNLATGYDQQVAGDSAGFNAFRDAALRQGPSDWANTAKQSQALETENQKEKGTESTAAANAAALDSLAAQGGLSSGARERNADAGAKNMTDMSQNVERQGNLNDLQIDMNDNQNKIQELSQLPGMETTRNNAWEATRQTDLANQLAENQAQNSYNQNAYNTQMQTWAANQQAQATANSGKK